MTAVRAIRQLVSVVLVCGAVIASTGCTPGGSAPCTVGTKDPVQTVRGFLTAVHDNDQGTAQKFLQPGGEIPSDAWNDLAARLDGIAVDQIQLSGDRMGTTTMVRAVLPDGTQLDIFQVSDQSERNAPQCTALYWGTYPTPASGSSPSASTAKPN